MKLITHRNGKWWNRWTGFHPDATGIELWRFRRTTWWLLGIIPIWTRVKWREGSVWRECRRATLGV